MSAEAIHYHTLFGVPAYGLVWTEDVHATARDAWRAVGHVLQENWEQDRHSVAVEFHRRNVPEGYAVGALTCASSTEPGRFHIPGLAYDDPGLVYGVTECTLSHVKVA